MNEIYSNHFIILNNYKFYVNELLVFIKIVIIKGIYIKI